ncbi:TonB-dependent receptor [bacterium]|nr:TonB-dependent receptor [bacterium]
MLRYIALFFLVWLTPAFAIDLTGYIRDKESGLPVSQAEITIANQSTITNSQGIFVLSNVKPGEWKLNVNHVAYKTLAHTIVVNDGINPSINLFITPLIYTHEEIVVKDTKEGNKIILPEAGPVKNLKHYLQELNSVQIIEGQQQTGVSIRGCRTNEVLIVVDGVPLAKENDGSYDLKILTAQDIRSIEVMTSGIPAKYSTQATGGLIKIETWNRNINFVEAVLGVGSFKSYQLSPRGAITLPMNLNFQGSMKFAKSDGDFTYKTHDSTATRDNNNQENLNLSLKLKQKIGNQSWSVVSYLTNFHEGMAGDLDHPTPEAYRKGYSLGLKGNYRGILPYSIVLLSNAYYANAKRHYYSPRPYVYVPVDSDHLTNSLRLNISLNREIKPFSLEIGNEYYVESYELVNNLNNDLNIDPKYRRIFSLWFETPIRHSPLKGFTADLTPAIRWEVINSGRTNNYFSLESGVAYHNAGILGGVEAGYSEAFRLPTFQDLYWLRDAFAEGNPDLAPEISYKRHLRIYAGFELNWFELSAGTDFFSRTVDSVIVWNRGFDGLYRPVNFSREETSGREDQVKIELLDLISFSWSNTLLTPLHRSEDPILDSLWLPFKPGYLQQGYIEINKWNASIKMRNRTIGKKFILPANTKWTEPYSIWDLYGKYSHSLGLWEFTITSTIENIFGEEYEVLAGYPMPGRNFELNLGLRYGYND